MHTSSHLVERPTRTVGVGAERHTIRVRRPGRAVARHRAIREQLGSPR